MRTGTMLAIMMGLLLGGGCADTVRPRVDAARGDASVEAGDVREVVTPGQPVDGVACGPNRCLAGEICCNARCGVCAFPDECVDHGCTRP